MRKLRLKEPRQLIPGYKLVSGRIGPKSRSIQLQSQCSLCLPRWMLLYPVVWVKKKKNPIKKLRGAYLPFSSCSIKNWRRRWHPTPVLLPGKFHGWRSLVGCSPWVHKESDTTEQLHFHFSLSCIGEGNGNPLQCSCLENPRDGGAWWAAVYGVTQSWTRLKRLSSSSSSTLGGIRHLFFIYCDALQWKTASFFPHIHTSVLSRILYNSSWF